MNAETSLVKTCLRPLLNAAHGTDFSEIRKNISHAQELVASMVVHVSTGRLPLYMLITSPIIPSLLAVATSIHSSNPNGSDTAPVIQALGANMPHFIVAGCIGGHRTERVKYDVDIDEIAKEFDMTTAEVVAEIQGIQDKLGKDSLKITPGGTVRIDVKSITQRRDRSIDIRTNKP